MASPSDPPAPAALARELGALALALGSGAVPPAALGGVGGNRAVEEAYAGFSSSWRDEAILGTDGAAGDPAEIRRVARTLLETARLADAAARRTGHAEGPVAAEGAAALSDEDRARHALRTMASSFHVAGAELATYAAELAGLQRRAALLATESGEAVASQATRLRAELDALAEACAEGMRLATLSVHDASTGRVALGAHLGTEARAGGLDGIAPPRPPTHEALAWARDQAEGVGFGTVGAVWRPASDTDAGVAFVQAAYRAAGIDLPDGDAAALERRYAPGLRTTGTPTPGALVLFAADGHDAPGHAGIADGEGGVYAAARPGEPVTTDGTAASPARGNGWVVHIDDASQRRWGARRGWVIP